MIEGAGHGSAGQQRPQQAYGWPIARVARVLLTMALLARGLSLGLTLGLSLCAAGAAAEPPDISGIVYAQRLGGELPLASRFTDQSGRSVALGDIVRSVPTVLVLGYFACPSLCGLIREDLFAALSRTGLRAGVDYRLVFVSIDPAETPAEAAAAMRSDLAANPTFGAGSGLHFLTGRRQDIDAVEGRVGYRSRYDLSLKQFIHPAGIVFVSPAGIVSSYLLGAGYRAGDVRAALVRARAGGVAKAALPILLICFHFDSATGRYTVAIAKLLRLAGALTVLTIVALLLTLRRHARKQRINASGSPT